jgi:hypothetical protein
VGFGDYAVVVVVVVVRSQVSGSAKPDPLFEYIWTFENNFESSPKKLFSKVQIGHRLNHVATPLPPGRAHTDIVCRNRRRHINCSNLRQRRREDTANDPNS